MALYTEEDVRRLSDGGTRGPVVLERGDVLTPSARTWLRERRIEVVRPAGGEGGSAPAGEGGSVYQTLFGAVLTEKPEHMTHLSGNTLVFKDHPRIVFRGWIDRLEAELLLARRAAADEGLPGLADDLGEALDFARRCIRYDVLGEPVGALTLCGLNEAQLREHSHHPERYYGQSHFLQSHTDSPALLAVNLARTTARQTELAAYQAFRTADRQVEREDILRGLNRLSSLLWILMVRCKAGRYDKR